MDQSFDAVIVGAGQAAKNSFAGQLTNAGWSVALVERNSWAKAPV